MTTQRSAIVNITNNSGGNAQIFLFHNNVNNGTQRGSWAASSGQTVGPLTVSGFGSLDILDYWSVLIHVKDGPTPGVYFSKGADLYPLWQECQLQREDADQMLTFSVSTTEFPRRPRFGRMHGQDDEDCPLRADHAPIRGDAGEPFVRQYARDVGHQGDHGRHHQRLEFV
jgi:hypothetical protein